MCLIKDKFSFKFTAPVIYAREVFEQIYITACTGYILDDSDAFYIQIINFYLHSYVFPEFDWPTG